MSWLTQIGEWKNAFLWCYNSSITSTNDKMSSLRNRCSPLHSRICLLAEKSDSPGPTLSSSTPSVWGKRKGVHKSFENYCPKDINIQWVQNDRKAWAGRTASSTYTLTMFVIMLHWKWRWINMSEKCIILSSQFMYHIADEVVQFTLYIGIQ